MSDTYLDLKAESEAIIGKAVALIDAGHSLCHATTEGRRLKRYFRVMCRLQKELDRMEAAGVDPIELEFLARMDKVRKAIQDMQDS